jgi:hypothetical protein
VATALVAEVEVEAVTMAEVAVETTQMAAPEAAADQDILIVHTLPRKHYILDLS